MFLTLLGAVEMQPLPVLAETMSVEEISREIMIKFRGKCCDGKSI